ncbi:hypothetical protein Lalb_Chr20g0122771 [Lupinus albus]|uniref:Uncharacterized protein n=1 Tax=Lupinus albus TaxID=3870 RepID=A0A6A4NQS1_LUPAL|nr:hypothetical protein Lalb_Chr20g0122771 [Lupinus albus]
MNLVHKENAELQKKVFEADVNEENVASDSPYTITDGYDLHAPISLQLSQSRPQYSQLPAKAIKLGLQLQ